MPSPQAWNCNPVPSGSYGPPDQEPRLVAFPCAPGRYSALPAATECLACAPGRFNEFGGATSCTPCAPGRAAASNGTVQCIDCAPVRAVVWLDSRRCAGLLLRPRRRPVLHALPAGFVRPEHKRHHLRAVCAAAELLRDRGGAAVQRVL